MALSDAYMLRDVQKFDGETVLNIYFFNDILLGSTAESLVDSFETGFLPKIVAIQSAGIEHVLLDAVSLGDPENFFEKAISEVGTDTGGVTPAFTAVNFGLRLNTRSVRPGSKRYSGISETRIDGNDVVGSGYITLLEALRTQQSDTLLAGVVPAFKQIVVKRVKYNPDPLDLEHFAYRLPETDEEFVFGDVVEALVDLKASHQVSRGNNR